MIKKAIFNDEFKFDENNNIEWRKKRNEMDIELAAEMEKKLFPGQGSRFILPQYIETTEDGRKVTKKGYADLTKCKDKDGKFLFKSGDPTFCKINLKMQPIFTKENSNCIINGLRKIAESLASLNIKAVPIYLTECQLQDLQTQEEIIK